MSEFKSATQMNSIEDYGQLQAYEIKTGPNRIILSRFGGQLISWEHNGIPILFENEHADLSSKTPYRGGAPICFAAFGDGKFIDGQSHSPSHGEARTTIWNIANSELSGNRASVNVQCISKSITGIPLGLNICYTLLNNTLGIDFTVRNVGLSPSPFQLAFHSYFHGDPFKASVEGIGEKYLDANDGFSEKFGDLGLNSSTRVNRIYTTPKQVVDLKMNRYDLTITNTNFPEIVVWNPGPEHTFKDLADPYFLCVESGRILNPPTLEPEEEWKGNITYKVSI